MKRDQENSIFLIQNLTLVIKNSNLNQFILIKIFIFWNLIKTIN